MAAKNKAKSRATRRYALRQASSRVASVTAFKLRKGANQFVPLNGTQTAAPNGQIVWFCSGKQGVTVTETLRRLHHSGGHLHPGGPVGSVEPARFTLNGPYPQNVRVVVTLPEAAGTIYLTASFSSGESVVNTNICRVLGLVYLRASTGIVLTGTCPEHPDNHFGTRTLVAKVKDLGAAFNKQFSKPIYVNDMSLRDGGLYDFKLTWAPPHKTHREGRTVDINSTSMSGTEKKFFRETAQALGFKVTLETSPQHWHLFI